MPVLLTPEQARERLFRDGITIKVFCQRHQLNRSMVSDLLNGRKKGLRGETRRAAILLGMKEGRVSPPPTGF